jgi:predicted permease
MSGLLGAALAAVGFRVLARALPLGAWGDSAAPDWRVFAAAMGAALLAAVLVVVVPTLSLWRGDLRGVLGRARTGGLEGRGGRLENGLVVTEVALAVLIASGAALLVRSVSNLYALDPGIATEHVAVVDVIAAGDMPPLRQWQTVGELLDAMRALPGVRTAGATQRLPLRGGGDSFGIIPEGQEGREAGTSFVRIVTGDYFATMGVRLRAGRLFEAVDRGGADSTRPERVVVVNEALAKKFFPGQSALGRTLGGGFRTPARIVGVIANVAEGKLTDEPEPARYFLSDQVVWAHGTYTIVLRVAPGTDPASVLDAARRTVSGIAPSFAVNEATTMQRVLDDAVGPARQVMSLLSLLTALALALGAVGIYGVIAHFAARRQRDWAIRVALGLPGSRVVALVVGHGTALVALGIVIGVLAAATLSRLLATFLFGVSSIDPIALAAASLVLLLVGLLAALIPARRAGLTDPAIALREQ